METVHQGVTLGVEEGLHLAPAPAPQSPPTHVLDLVLGPTAAPAPTHGPGPHKHINTQL